MSGSSSEPPVLRSGSFGRASKLLGLPLGAAARAGADLGRRLLGTPAEEVAARSREAAAEQLFTVLGELKGGAMKFGQALSLFEAMLPEDVAEPFRDRLRALQDSAPPMPAARAQAVLKAELGPDWRRLLPELDQRPAAAASIGQVHRGQLADGTEVAVKIQYPGADVALASDLRQLQRLSGVATTLTGGLDLLALSKELSLRVAEEVDYTQEASHQAAMAAGTAGHPRFVVPRVHHATRRVLISDWIEGRKLTSVIGRPQAERNQAALDYVSFLFSGPELAGILHADPHPGNFLLTADGRLGVVDFGLVSRLPDGLPAPMGRLIRHAVDGQAELMRAGLIEEGFIGPDVDAAEVLDYLAPFVEPAQVAAFSFNRDWARQQFQRVQDAMAAKSVATRISLPPDYLLIYRVWLGGIAVLAQLDVQADFASVLRAHLPGFAPEPG